MISGGTLDTISRHITLVNSEGNLNFTFSPRILVFPNISSRDNIFSDDPFSNVVLEEEIATAFLAKQVSVINVTSCAVPFSFFHLETVLTHFSWLSSFPLAGTWVRPLESHLLQGVTGLSYRPWKMLMLLIVF